MFPNHMIKKFMFTGDFGTSQLLLQLYSQRKYNIKIIISYFYNNRTVQTAMKSAH